MDNHEKEIIKNVEAIVNKKSDIKEQVEDKLTQIEEEAKAIGALEEKKKWQKVENKHELIQIKDVINFLNWTLRISFNRDLQARVNCVLCMWKKLEKEFGWYFFLGRAYADKKRAGEDNLQQAEIRFHKRFEALVEVFLHFLDETRHTQQVGLHHHQNIFEAIRKVVMVIPFKFCF